MLCLVCGKKSEIAGSIGWAGSVGSQPAGLAGGTGVAVAVGVEVGVVVAVGVGVGVDPHTPEDPAT